MIFIALRIYNFSFKVPAIIKFAQLRRQQAVYNGQLRIMINSLQIQRLILPRLFLFDTIQLSAKFVTTSVHLTTIKFSSSQSIRQRNISINVQLKIPTARSQFILSLQVKIINMFISAVQIPVDLCLLGDCNKFQFVFQTDLGRVRTFVNAIDEIYLPKESVQISSNGQSSLLANSHGESAVRSSSMIEELKIYHKSNDEIRDEQEQSKKGGQKQKNMAKRHYSNKLKPGKKNQKMALSRSQYMKIEVDESLLVSDPANAETESEVKEKVKQKI